MLVGLDLPYGYPAGFAAALGVAGWAGVWEYLDDRIHDDAHNRSNRFDLAADMNAQLGAWGPFWGRPTALDLATLPVRKEVSYRGPSGRHGLPEWRATEDMLRSLGATPQPVWKLAYTGSVGSQSLVGIPVVRHVRFHEELRQVSRVWPFEVGQPALDVGSAAIIHAEIWPSIVPLDRETDSCRDEQQVRAVVRHWRELDQSAHLAELFGLESTSEPVRREEGWILGVPSRASGALPDGRSRHVTLTAAAVAGPAAHPAETTVAVRPPSTRAPSSALASRDTCARRRSSG